MGVQLAAENIRVNAVCPGFIKTGLTAGLQANDFLNDTLSKSKADPLRHTLDKTVIVPMVTLAAAQTAAILIQMLICLPVRVYLDWHFVYRACNGQAGRAA